MNIKKRSILILLLAFMVVIALGCGNSKVEPTGTENSTNSGGDANQTAPTANEDKGLEFPTKTVTIVVGSGPGSTMDFIARGLAPSLQNYWGQPVVVKNSPGANQSVAFHETVDANPDGHTLYVGVGNTIGIHDYYGSINIDWKDFEWIGNIISDPYTWFTHKDSGIETFEDFLALDPARYGDSGYESPVHPFALDIFEAFDMNYVFTPGYDPGGVVEALQTGEQQLLGRDAAFFLRLGTDNDYRAIVTSAVERQSHIPDTPTLSEIAEQYGVDLAPKEIYTLHFLLGTTPGTDHEIVDYIADSIKYLIQEDADFQAWLEENYLTDTVVTEKIGRDYMKKLVNKMTEEFTTAGLDEWPAKLQ